MSSTATHKDLVEEFQARVNAQQSTPLAVQDLTAERDRLAGELAVVRQELAQERAATAVLRRIAAELALELDQARSTAACASNVTKLPVRRTLAARPGRKPERVSLPGSPGDRRPGDGRQFGGTFSSSSRS